MEKLETTISSMEVAKMIGKSHHKLLRDIRNYEEQLGKSKIGYSDFFTESTYQSEQNKTMPCYQVTKKGCEFIAHKLTGVKGAEFTAKYINRFHEMEEQLKELTHPDWYYNNIKVFQHPEFGILRTAMVEGQPCFIGKDVTKMLGYVNALDALQKRVEDEDKMNIIIYDGRQDRTMVAINEAGLYQLILTSKMPLSHKLKMWMVQEVIPTLRGLDKQAIESLEIRTKQYKDDKQEAINKGFERLSDSNKNIILNTLDDVLQRQEYEQQKAKKFVEAMKEHLPKVAGAM